MGGASGACRSQIGELLPYWFDESHILEGWQWQMDAVVAVVDIQEVVMLMHSDDEEQQEVSMRRLNVEMVAADAGPTSARTDFGAGRGTRRSILNLKIINI